MGYQIDYLQVGNGENSGDCIAIRTGDLHSGDPKKQSIIIIDGGYQETGDKLAKFIRERYGDVNFIDLVVATHLDGDHIGGLSPVFQNFYVGTLLMHRPWLHAVRGDGEAEKEMAAARRHYDKAWELEELASAQTLIPVKIGEPLAGTRIDFGPTAFMYILGPDLPYYTALLAEYDHNESTLKKLSAALGMSTAAVSEILTELQETIHPGSSTLDSVHKNTSPENRSSAIIYFYLDGHEMLFTGDAGVESLHRAVDHASAIGLSLNSLRLLDVPHHGSKHNLDLRFLDRVTAQHAIISATQDSKKHPSPRVYNELLRRGYSVATTEKCNILLDHDAPPRPDYSPVQPYEMKLRFKDDE